MTVNCPYCNTPIDEHEAGRGTDVCVAVAVMGMDIRGEAVWENSAPLHDRDFVFIPCPYYSTDIAAAWIIWNRCISQLFSERDRFFAVLEDDLTERNKEHERGWRIAWPHAMMNLSPFAICRAALKAIIVIQERKVTA